MGKYILDNETVKVEFPDGQWVMIKEELTQSDHDYILNRMAKAQQSSKGDTTMEFDLGKACLLERAVVDWSFTNGANEKIPVTSENVTKMRTKYRVKILSEIDRLNREALEFASKN